MQYVNILHQRCSQEHYFVSVDYRKIIPAFHFKGVVIIPHNYKMQSAADVTKFKYTESQVRTC